MKLSGNHKWFALTLMGIIVPISLLTAFKLTGIIPEPKQPETITVSVVSSNVTRPSRTITFAWWVENNYSDGIASVNLKVAIDTYYVGSMKYAAFICPPKFGFKSVQKGDMKAFGPSRVGML